MNGNALDKVAHAVGKHRTTLAKAEAVVDAAEAEPVAGDVASRTVRPITVEGVG